MQRLLFSLFLLLGIGWVNIILESYYEEVEKRFVANCEYYHGIIEKDSYGTLHCVIKDN